MPEKLTLSRDSFFVARNSLKYGEKSYCVAYFNEFYLTFSQNRIKIGPKFFSSLKSQNQDPGKRGPGGEGPPL